MTLPRVFIAGAIGYCAYIGEWGSVIALTVLLTILVVTRPAEEVRTGVWR